MTPSQDRDFMGHFPKICFSRRTQIDWIVALRESYESIGTNFAKTTTTRSVVQIADSLSRDGRKYHKTEKKISQALRYENDHPLSFYESRMLDMGC